MAFLASATLEKTGAGWLASLLRAFDAGDIAEYEALIALHGAKLEGQPALLSNATFLKEKITLMCLAQTLFARIGPAADRTVPFGAIAAATRLPMDEIELLLMRALSLGLIRGVIDQVDQTVRIEWVQPRVLPKAQISLMADRLKEWSGRVDEQLHKLDSFTPEFAVY